MNKIRTYAALLWFFVVLFVTSVVKLHETQEMINLIFALITGFIIALYSIFIESKGISPLNLFLFRLRRPIGYIGYTRISSTSMSGGSGGYDKKPEEESE